MKHIPILSMALLLFMSMTMAAQNNTFLERSYWKANPSIAQVQEDMSAGHDITAMTSSAFDPVCWAILEKTNMETIKFLLEQPGNGPNKKTHDGRTYIFWAAYKNNLELIQHLVDLGARTDLKDSHGYSLLNFAAVTGQQNQALYDFCIARGANPKVEKNNDGANALLLVAPFLEDESLIDYFTAAGIDLHAVDHKGDGIFNYAAKKGNTSVLDLLIKKGVAYKKRNAEGGNAFIMASQGTRNSSNTLETYKYLEALGLEPNIVTDNGFTPLHALAYRNTDLEIFNYFIEKGVGVDQPDINGNTAFSNASYRNDLESIVFLARHSKAINAANKKGVTPLMRAVHRNTVEVVEFLLKEDADAFAKDATGNTLTYYLIQSYDKRKPKIFDQKLALLKAKKLDFKVAQADGNSLWHLAVKENDMGLLKKIALLNIPINIRNTDGNTPLHLAAMKAKNKEILELLLAKGADKSIKTTFEESVYDLASENELLQKNGLTLNFLK
ncbi:ankyrin repeat domain-containing protein [Spongiimicrobium salis]|uniref:ankyrin repeat domain-containing protein n=1 Tax=Spongiimicrobium salis TaxID=1667022 RepID=UPI00374CB6B3